MEPNIRFARTADGGAVAFWELGDGPTLLHLPWLPWGHAQLECRDPELSLWYESLCSVCRLVRYDGRGSGLSDWEATDYGLETQVRDMTTTMRCGTMVAGNTFRNPAILAKVAVTLDHVSGGRFELGMGSGHIQFEHEQYNIPYYTRGRRLRMLGEAARIVRSLLTVDRTSFRGRYYELSEALCEPKPLQDPMPILIGGIGEDLTMRVVAESADIWNNWTSPDLETYKGKLEALRRHCADVGRDPSDIRKSLHIKPLIGESDGEVEERASNSDRHRSRGTVEKVTEDLLSFVEVGVSDFVFMLDSVPDDRSLELLATRVAPVVRAEGSRVKGGVATPNP